MTPTIIKLGSSLFVSKDSQGQSYIDYNNINKIAREILKIKKDNSNIIIVSSGSIAIARQKLNITNDNLGLSKKQSLSAYGQFYLMQILTNAFQEVSKDVKIAQTLVSGHDLQSPRGMLNLRAALSAILEDNIIPIINENDATSTHEIRLGNNDIMAFSVAKVMSAKRLILLSDVQGLYDKNPNKNKDAMLITKVNNITQDLFKSTDETGSDFGTGGMHTKILAAKMAQEYGIETIITSGKQEGIYNSIKEKNVTKFEVKEPIKSLLNEFPESNGEIDFKTNKYTIDNIVNITGEFKRGEKITIKNTGQTAIAEYDKDVLISIQDKKKSYEDHLRDEFVVKLFG